MKTILITLFLSAFSFSDSYENIQIIIDSLNKESDWHIKQAKIINSIKDSLNSLIQLKEQKESKRISAKVIKYGIIYERPNLTSKELDTVNSSDSIEILNCIDNWYRIKKDNLIGYLLVKTVEDNKYLELLCKENLQKQISNGLKDLKKKYHYILLNEVNISEPNSAGGVNVNVQILNLSNKVIKYIKLYVYSYNSVGDKVKCEIRNSPKQILNVTGPIKPLTSSIFAEAYGDINLIKDTDYFWENVWYNTTITCVEISKVEVFFVDGEKYVYINELQKILSENVKNDCSYTQ